MNPAFEIDELSAMSPDMSDAELQSLAQSIRAVGQQIPILVWRGKIIDGRKRLAACRAVDVEPIITVLRDDAPATQLAADINLMRTHYSASQRALYAARISNMSVGRPDSGNGANWPHSTAVPVAKAASALGVSPRTVKRARRVVRLAAPDVASAVERGDITLNAACEIVNSVPRDEQAAEVDAVADRTRDRRTTNGGPARSALPVSKALPRRDPDVLRQRALESIHGAATVLDQYADAPIRSNAQVAYWRDLVDGSMRTLRLLRKRLEVEHASA